MKLDFKNIVIEVAKMLAVSAKTAPKARGIDDLEIVILTNDEDLEKLAAKMDELSKDEKLKFFARDAGNVRQSHAVLLLGVRSSKSKELDCGGCGFETCSEFRKTVRRSGKGYTGPSCVFQLMDLGIAVGSAVKTASIFNIDNRVMYSIGVAALKLGLLKESEIALGIPLSAYGKNIYYDRK
ncbi:MAG: DUF2148 domain-containing protein [Candidatus Bathyarchaeia archaeon]